MFTEDGINAALAGQASSELDRLAKETPAEPPPGQDTLL